MQPMLVLKSYCKPYQINYTPFPWYQTRELTIVMSLFIIDCQAARIFKKTRAFN
jgi:hypothetical protein